MKLPVEPLGLSADFLAQRDLTYAPMLYWKKEGLRKTPLTQYLVASEKTMNASPSRGHRLPRTATRIVAWYVLEDPGGSW